jgi:hypothetical protein
MTYYVYWAGGNNVSYNYGLQDFNTEAEALDYFKRTIKDLEVTYACVIKGVEIDFFLRGRDA